MIRHARATFLLPIMLGGCVSGFPGARPQSYATPGEAHVYATGDKCVHEPTEKEFGGLIAAALTGVASQLLKNFGSALSEGAKGGALPSSTSTQNLQLDPGKTPKCIVIIRGSFQPTTKDPSALDLATYIGLATNAADERKRLMDLNLPPIYRVDHYIELRLGASNNGKALTFVPIFLKLGQSIDGATMGERDLSVAVKFNRAGADPVGSVVVLADRKVGIATKWDPLKSGGYTIEAPWFGTFHASPAPAGTTPPVAATPGSTIPPMQSASADAVPVTVTATVVETRPTNEGLAFVASVFNGLEPKIEEAIKPIIDSDVRRTAEAAEATGTLGAQADYSVAEGAAQAARITYCSASSAGSDAAGKQDRITKSTTARVAQLKANVAAIKAEIAQPYPNLILISADLPTSVNVSGCSGI